ncbi:hypothetical protein GCM10009552_15830 [Rothia nasimurium]|uniref:Uncharacterized protein n=1 Tax=Luteibacter anthropi TaxID=564369 RepID=A0A7X5UB35_9GAMM|nr:hypothetical protein [Luteibacter anthropi]NII07245.1 hypothetical protein [Luteibacter anthropi]
MIAWIVIAILLLGAVGLRFWLRRYQDGEPAPVAVAAPEPVLPTAAESAPSEDLPMSLLSGLLAKFQLIASLIPLLTSMVQTVEAALPDGTPGAVKLKAVEDALASAYAKEQNSSVAFSEVWPALSGIASSLVATFKAAGTFTSSTAANSAPSTLSPAAASTHVA